MNNQPPSPEPSSAETRVALDALFNESEFALYRLAAIVESAEDAIISKTLDGIITSWNRGAERLFGYTEDEMVGKPVMLLIPPDHHNEEPEILARLRRGQKIEHYETVRVRKDGTLLDISLTVSPIRAPDGTIIGASKIARDITERKQAAEKLQRALADAEEARKQAEEANRLKDDFLMTISHELRTPLTAVVGWITMLRAGRLDPLMAQKAMETIERNIKAQAQLVEDLLDISRMASGKMRLDVRPLNLSTIIHNAVDSIIPAAEAKNIRLQMIIDPSTGAVVGDADRLQQVIWNLLSNAVKFTPGGGRVQVCLEQSGNNAEITVSDNGKGVSPDFLPSLFDRFTQEDSSSTRTHGGLGMGLSIVKYITELHGGTVRASSEGLEKGISFTVALPLAPEKPGPLTTSTGSRLTGDLTLDYPAELAGLQILVVDDELDTCEMIKVAFEESGSTVKTATGASQALEVLQQWRPDILICDINMPHMDGYQLIRQIREREPQNEPKIPAVALTALARIEDRMKALTVGYQMHVPKPVEISELYAVVAGLSTVTIK